MQTTEIKQTQLDYTSLNALLNIVGKDGKLQLEKDKEAAKQYFLEHVNKNTQFFHNLKEKLDYLVEHDYYDEELLKQYGYEDIKRLFKYVYSFKYRFPSFVGAYKFYSQYALKTNDKERYLERFEDRLCMVALNLAQGDITKAFEYAKELITGRYQPATPTVLSSGRKQRGELTSCYLMNVEDNLEDISRSITNSLQLSKRGGGVAICLTNIREQGAPIKNVKGASSGVLPIMKLYEDSFTYANQLGSRQGAGAVYIHAHHPDIITALDTKRENADEKVRIKTLSIGVVIPDITFELARNNEQMYLFSPYDILRVYGKPMSDINISEMYHELVDNKEIRKKKISARMFFQTLAEIQTESGYPYIVFEDTVNRDNPIKGRIKMSNLCVAPETTLLTDKGLVPIKSAANTEQIIWNGTEWSKAVVAKTGENQKLLKVTLSNGKTLDATEYHKWSVQVGLDEFGRPILEEVETQNLAAGDQLEDFIYPVLDNADIRVKKVFDLISKSYGYNINSNPEVNEAVRITCDLDVNANMLVTELMYLGIHAKQVDHVIGAVGNKSVVVLDKENFNYLLSLGLEWLGKDYIYEAINAEYVKNYQPKDSHPGATNVFVVSVKDEGRIDDTYCVNEPLKHKAVFNGILTHQCTEILQIQESSTFNEDGSYDKVGLDISCNLGSLNIVKAMDSEDFGQTVATSIRMLTSVADQANFNAVPSIKNGNDSSKAIGLGQMNLHGFFMLNDIEYGDEASVEFTDLYFMTVTYYALLASNELAKERGTYFKGFKDSKYATGEYFDKYTKEDFVIKSDKVKEVLAKYPNFRMPSKEDWLDLKEQVMLHGIYNRNLQAVAPTGSISYVNNSTPCIHPVTDVIERRKEGVMGVVYYPAPYLTNENYSKYKNAYEIGYEKIIDVYAAAAKHVDQGLSLTLFFNDKATTRDINKAQIYAWKKGIKTIYYIRVKRGALEGTKIKECVSCSV